MAIYHLNVKPLSRSKGHTAGNALAYECGQKLETIEGKTVDFSQKEVLRSEIIGHPGSLQALADKMELSENRKNSTLGRRFTIALPDELDRTQQWDSAQEFGKWLNKQYGVGVVVSMHAPDKGGDERNTHAHITITDRRIDEKGNFGEKARELTAAKSSKIELNRIREKWELVANIALDLSGSAEEISHKSHKARGLLVQPTKHLGLVKTQQARKQKDNRPAYKITQVIENEVIKSKNERILRERSAIIRGNQKGRLQLRRDRGNDEDLGKRPEQNQHPTTKTTASRKATNRSSEQSGQREIEREIFGEPERKPKSKIRRILFHLGQRLQKLRGLDQSKPSRGGERESVTQTQQHNRNSEQRKQGVSSQRTTSSRRTSSSRIGETDRKKQRPAEGRRTSNSPEGRKPTKLEAGKGYSMEEEYKKARKVIFGEEKAEPKPQSKSKGIGR